MLNFTEFLLGTSLLIICIQEFFEYVTLLKSFFFSFVLDLPDWHKLYLISNDFKCSVFSCDFHKRGKPLSRHLFPVSSLCSFYPVLSFPVIFSLFPLSPPLSSSALLLFLLLFPLSIPCFWFAFIRFGSHKLTS